MRHAKSGQWWNDHPEYALANNSVAYTEKPDVETFMREWLALVESKSGERGIFNREASRRQSARNGRRDSDRSFGTNPCSEIILRDRQFCNLSEVVVRPRDTFDDLKRKVRIATILGTLQATLTNFRYLSPKWKESTEEEALLGVSLTGIMDHPIMSGNAFWNIAQEGGVFTLEHTLEALQKEAINVNKEWAEKLGINQSAAITCVKPSGTVSQLVDSASGIHARHSPYYIRTVRGDVKDPLTQFMIDSGFQWEYDLSDKNPDTGELRKNNVVFSFPKKVPSGAICTTDRTAIQQLELWLLYQRHWCEHKPSITINVKENEWVEVGAWVWKHFDEVSGVSFLPYSDHIYPQAPYQEITEEEYEKLVALTPEVAWSNLQKFEEYDTTKGSQELSCTGGVCEIVDI